MCNVSTQTVSRVINHQPDVAPGTRDFIEATITSMNYRPNSLARGLRQRRSYTLGILLPGNSCQGFSDILDGVIERCGQLDYALLFKRFPGNSPTLIENLIQSFVIHPVDGVILIYPKFDLALLASTLPILYYSAFQPEPLITPQVWTGADRDEHFVGAQGKRMGIHAVNELLCQLDRNGVQGVVIQ